MSGERTEPISSADILARLGTLQEYLKAADMDVGNKKSDLWNAEQSRNRIKREMEAWEKALAALKEAGLHL